MPGAEPEGEGDVSGLRLVPDERAAVEGGLGKLGIADEPGREIQVLHVEIEIERAGGTSQENALSGYPGAVQHPVAGQDIDHPGHDDDVQIEFVEGEPREDTVERPGDPDAVRPAPHEKAALEFPEVPRLHPQGEGDLLDVDRLRVDPCVETHRVEIDRALEQEGGLLEIDPEIVEKDAAAAPLPPADEGDPAAERPY